MKKLIIMILMIVPLLLGAQSTYYVAPTGGDDNNVGTDITAPWATWQKAFSTADAGDTVYFRGGVWYPQDHSRGSAVVEIHTKDGIGHAGTREAPIQFFNYPGETPILDCSQVDMTGNRFNSAVDLNYTSWIHIKGLTVRNVVQPVPEELANGVGSSECSYMTFENLTVHDVGGRGMSYWGVAGHPTVPEIPTDTTRFINCDIYDCVDWLSSDPGNGSDGIKMDAESETYLYFYGCRSWGCGDDGFDISGPGITVYDHCWSFNQGFPGALDGNGFKFGGNRGANANRLPDGSVPQGDWVYGVRKVVKNCISAGNLRDGMYDLAYAPLYPNNSRVYNNSIYDVGIGIHLEINQEYEGVNISQYYNNIVYNVREKNAAEAPYIGSMTNTWYASNNTFKALTIDEAGSLPWIANNADFTVTDADFVSLDIEELKSPRKPDGSLPDVNFMKLTAGSDLIDGGVDLELTIASELRDAGIDANTYIGSAPDLGAIEYSVVVGVPPTASFIATPTTITEGESVSFDASGSADSDGTIVSYAWSFGNGSGTGVTTSQTYNTDGTYTASLTVTDNDGNSASTSQTITVNAVPVGTGIYDNATLITAMSTAQPGDVLYLSANTFTGDVVFDCDGTSTNPIVIQPAATFTPVFSGSATVTGDHITLRELTFNGGIELTSFDTDLIYCNINSTLNLNQCTSPRVTNNIFTGVGDVLDFTLPRTVTKGRNWAINNNTYNIGINSKFKGYSYGLYRANYYNFDINSTVIITP